MFNKILIANRGEIACRIINTAKKMGIQTVAVYSTADNNSLHVTMADSAYCIGEAKAQDSYLNSKAIIAAALDSGSEAIHPGYGFLSENADFAKACDEAGIVFIGPTVAAMQAMASKQVAKQLLEKSKVPLTPGYHGLNQSDDTLLSHAEKIGFPVLLKAANGGGGKGMRTVLDKTTFTDALAAARRESMACFADDTIIIEKLITNPRHIEVQIMADNYGNVVHLFERDCSLQRRHQKIIEEAPAPHLKDALRQKLTQAACEVARSIDYRGAGTVEFLVDETGQFYFMEMNTRLQVEHPVTEMITGLDLVAWQIRIAANQPLPCEQAAITAQGHAIECRIYAEDPENQFMPSVGQLFFIKPPEGEGLRLDTGVAVGSAITMYYDPMIAKLIAWGATRDEALQRLSSALAHFAIGGVKTNLAFLQAIIDTPAFKKARITTDFLDRETITLPTPDTKQALLAVAALDYIKLIQNTTDPLWKKALAWQFPPAPGWVWRYQMNGQTYYLTIQPVAEQQLTITLQDESITLTATYLDHTLTLDNGHEKNSLVITEHQALRVIYFPEGVVTLSPYTTLQTPPTAHLKQELTSPMPATVVAILKQKGDHVKQGDRLVVVEAMKMEHTIHAPKDGIVSEIYYDIGTQVAEGVELIALR